MIAKPAGIRTVVTGIPSYTGHDASTPTRFFRLGRFTLGNPHGFYPSYGLELAQQVLYPIPPVWELLAYDIRNGASCLFQELVDVPSLTGLQPWDRTPLAVGALVPGVVNGATAETASFTYTVPAGRRLLISRITCQVSRLTVATTLVEVSAYLKLDGNFFAYCALTSNVPGASISDVGGHGWPMLNAGQILVGYRRNDDTGGTARVSVGFSGFLFDA